MAIGYTSGDERKLDVAGGTMAGPLILADDPSDDLGAATKQYVDDAIPDVSAKVSKAGDTMTGALVLSGAPSSGLHATTKTYVDTADALALPKAGGTMTGALVLSGAPTTGLNPTTKTYVDAADALAVPLAGGTMTGLLTLSGSPSSSGHAATKGYVDSVAVGPLSMTAVKTSVYTAAASDFVPVDTTSGSVTITLPTAPSDGTRVGVKHVVRGSTNTVTIARGGSDVFEVAGGATSYVLTLLYQGVTLTYKASTSIWYATAANISLAQLDARHLQLANNLSDLASASTARTNLGLGGSATLAVGTSAGTVAAGDDSRITGAAQKSSNLSDLASASTARTNLGLGGAAVLAVGTSAGTVAAGDDSRMTNTRTPSASSVTDAMVASPGLAPSSLNLATWTPSDHGYLTWSIDPAYAGTGSTLTTAGVMHLIKVKLPVAGTITYACLFLTALASSSVSNCYVALYDSGGTRRAVTADLTTPWTAATGYLEHAFASPYSASAGTYYVGLLTGAAGTLPSFSRNASTIASNSGLSAPGLRFGVYGSSQTSAPSSVTLASVTATTSAASASYFVGLK